MKKLPFSILPNMKCEWHGIYDMWPCPWPGCPKGILESEFEVENLIPGKEPDVYQRHEWFSSDQEKYYTWQLANFPKWFSCKKTLWSEARRRNLITSPPVDIVYHYTSIDGFMGILNSNSIWLTDYSYLNDRQEILHGLGIIRSVANELLSNSSNKDACKLLESWIANLDNINGRVCIASFSANGDSLSQWRAYGTIAIGFKMINCALHFRNAPIQPVEYDENSQYSLARIYLNHLCQSYAEDISNTEFGKVVDVYHDTTQLIELASFFKNSAFHDEHEFRSVFIEHPRVAESLRLEKPKKHFHSINNHIIPYISSGEIYHSDENENRLEIEEVVLRPNSDKMLEKGVREFLLEHELGDVSIRRSSIPYRT